MQRDLILQGVTAGLIANLIKVLIAWPLYLLGWVEYIFVHMAAGFYLPKEFILTPIGLALGHITDFAIGAFLGIFLLLIYRKTGNNHPLLKGVIYGIFIHIALYGIVISFNITSAVLKTPLPNLILLLPHIVFGLTCSWAIANQYK